MLTLRPTVSHPDQSKTAWDWETQSATQRDLTHKSMIALARLLFCSDETSTRKAFAGPANAYHVAQLIKN